MSPLPVAVKKHFAKFRKRVRGEVGKGPPPRTMGRAALTSCWLLAFGLWVTTSIATTPPRGGSAADPDGGCAIYVSPSGEDAGPGSSAAPLRTLAAAQAARRRLDPDTVAVVCLAPGRSAGFRSYAAYMFSTAPSPLPVPHLAPLPTLCRVPTKLSDDRAAAARARRQQHHVARHAQHAGVGHRHRVGGGDRGARDPACGVEASRQRRRIHRHTVAVGGRPGCAQHIGRPARTGTAFVSPRSCLFVPPCEHALVQHHAHHLLAPAVAAGVGPCSGTDTITITVTCGMDGGSEQPARVQPAPPGKCPVSHAWCEHSPACAPHCPGGAAT